MNGYPSATGQAQDRESSPAKDRSLPLYHETRPIYVRVNTNRIRLKPICMHGWITLSSRL